MRIFVAIDLPDDLKKKIFSFARKVTEKLKVKLVEEENLHLSLIFLGKVNQREIDLIKEVLLKTKMGEINLALGQVSVFPHKMRPELVWIKVGGQTGKLFSLYKKIIDGLLQKGFTLKDSNLRFLPHITLARVKGGGVGSMESLKLEEKFTVEKVSLFESRLTSQGPRYSKIGEFEIK